MIYGEARQRIKDLDGIPQKKEGAEKMTGGIVMGRIEKVNQSIKKEVGYILQDKLQDPRLQFVTITEAEVSKDLQHARIYFSVLGDHAQFETALETLNRARGLIRRLLAQRLEMRYIPEVEFFIDKSVEYGARIDQAIEDIHHEFGEDR